MKKKLLKFSRKRRQLAHFHNRLVPQFLLDLLARWRRDVRCFPVRHVSDCIRGSLRDLLGDGLIVQELAM